MIIGKIEDYLFKAMNDGKTPKVPKNLHYCIAYNDQDHCTKVRFYGVWYDFRELTDYERMNMSSSICEFHTLKMRKGLLKRVRK